MEGNTNLYVSRQWRHTDIFMSDNWGMMKMTREVTQSIELKELSWNFGLEILRSTPEVHHYGNVVKNVEL